MIAHKRNNMAAAGKHPLPRIENVQITLECITMQSQHYQCVARNPLLELQGDYPLLRCRQSAASACLREPGMAWKPYSSARLRWSFGAGILEKFLGQKTLQPMAGGRAQRSLTNPVGVEKIAFFLSSACYKLSTDHDLAIIV